MNFSKILQSNPIKIFLFFIFILYGCSNYYDIGQDPASVRWKQIKTKNFQIIYPREYEQQAQRVANTLEYAYLYATKMLNRNPKKVSVILHTRTVIPNGLTSWAPKRMEFLTCPPQDIYSQDWLEQLCIHEFRHVIQMDKMNQGFTRLLSLIFGQQATAGILGLFIPSWLLEGDAVCAETGLSNSGRGRVPSFEMPLRAQLLEKKRYFYEKAIFGSYRDFVPDYYILGYHFVAQTRKKYDSLVWSKAINKAAKNPTMITPFNKGLKRITGKRKVKLYKEIFDDLKNEWIEQSKKIDYTDLTIVSPEQKSFTNYQFPHYLNDSLIVAIRSGIDDINRLVTVNKKTKKDEQIFTPGLSLNESMKQSGSLMCWTEIIPHIRWENENYSVIVTYDFKTKKRTYVSKKSRYFAPSISPNGDQIAAVEVSNNNDYSLVILENKKNGKLIKKIPLPNNNFIVTPQWSEVNKIVAIALDGKGKSIVQINPQTAEVKYLIPFTYTEILNPILYKNYILFTGAYSGINNIYTLNILNGEVFQVTSSKFGADFASISHDGDYLIYADYTSNGYVLAEVFFNPENWMPFDKVKDFSIKLYETIAQQENGKVISGNIPTITYPSKSYTKILHLFNFHSWNPGFADLYRDNIYPPAISLYSQNKLSTAFTSLGYRYNMGNATNSFFADFTYKGFFPVFRFVKEIVNNRQDVKKLSDTMIDDHFNKTIRSRSIRYHWREDISIASVSIPFNLSRGKYFKGIIPAFQYTYRKIMMDPNSPVELLPLLSKTLGGTLTFYNQLKTSERDIFPRYAQMISGGYEYDMKGKNYISHFSSSFYFPGAAKHDGFKFYLGWQEKNHLNNYSFSDVINKSRGYIGLNDNNRLYSWSINYFCPLLYPDFHIGSLIYMKRVKSNIFFDHTSIRYENKTKSYPSAGIELTFDVHILRFFSPIQFGFIYAYNFNNKSLHVYPAVSNSLN